MLEVVELDVGYGDVKIVDAVSLTVGEGEVVALVGANGAGKTTLLRGISGVLPARRGKVRFLGVDVTGEPAYKLVERGLVHVPENRALFPVMTVLENLELGAYIASARRRRRESMQQVFRLFPVLAERQSQLAGTLSGGEQQMLAIGRGLMTSPRMLILDEPSLGLAPIMVMGIFRAIMQIRELGTPVLLVEQNVKHALRISHRGYVLENGRIALEGMSDYLLGTELVRQAYLGGATLTSGRKPS